MNIILKQQAAEFEGTSVPDFPLPIAVEPSSIFQEMQGTNFELDVGGIMMPAQVLGIGNTDLHGIGLDNIGLIGRMGLSQRPIYRM